MPLKYNAEGDAILGEKGQDLCAKFLSWTLMADELDDEELIELVYIQEGMIKQLLDNRNIRHGYNSIKATDMVKHDGS
jgi:hypothetical protein